MSEVSNAKTRQAARDSLYLSTDVTVVGAKNPVTVRVRNLSPGGMMIDANVVFHEGARVSAGLRGIGVISGSIAWVVDDRAGVAFDEEIDPKEARMPVGAKPQVLFTPIIDKSRRPGLKIR